MNKRIPQLLALVCLALQVRAQTQGEPREWRTNLRPIHTEQISFTSEEMQRAKHNIGSQATAPISSIGEQRVPVILVAFADKAFTVADSTDAGVNRFYDLYCNGTMDGNLYTAHGSHGALRDYFVQQSDSLFLPLFTVIGPVTLDNGYATYGSNNGDTKDTGYNAFRDEALSKAQALYQGDWNDFDNDADGTVDMALFVYAGLGENYVSDTDPDCIWPSETTSRALINGTAYACNAATCELRPAQRDEQGNVTATQPDGIGLMVHELSHALGLPDFYDLNDVAFGMDIWSVMDYGNYAGNGYTPCNYTAYERDFMAWRRLIDIDEPAVLTIPCFADGGTGYRITNAANPDECLILENRQAKGWDDALATLGHGLQVTHVDYSQPRWVNNNVNTDPAHQHMTIIPANNSLQGASTAPSDGDWLASLAGNLYPGTSLNYSLTDTSTPQASLYTGQLLQKPIIDITENPDSTVILCFRTNGQLDAPEAYQPELTEPGTYLLVWSDVDNATQYALQLYNGQTFLRADTLQDTYTQLTSLPTSKDLSYRVQALADTPYDYLPSPWSEPVHFYKPVDAIQGLTQSELLVYVYNTAGIPVTHCHADELNRLSLRRGIYILRYTNGSAKKVIIK